MYQYEVIEGYGLISTPDATLITPRPLDNEEKICWLAGRTALYPPRPGRTCWRMTVGASTIDLEDLDEICKELLETIHRNGTLSASAGDIHLSPGENRGTFSVYLKSKRLWDIRA